MKTNQIRNFCIISHVDHGKSTLADRLLEITGSVEKGKMKDQLLDSMELEREKGITIKLAPATMYWDHGGQEFKLNLIDTPGHVDFSYEVSRSLEAVEGAVLLVDATKGIQAQTLNNLRLAQQSGLKIIPAVNKIDLPEARVEEVAFEIAELIGCELDDIQLISAKTGEGVEKLLDSVINKIPSPDKVSSDYSRALVFDSFYDDYRGVVVYVRVTDGSFKKGEKIKFFRQGTESMVSNLGEITLGLNSKDRISAGDIGFIVTTLKEVGEARVGDTVCKADTPDEFEPLSGYKEPKPVVFAEFFCSSSEDYIDLREALQKLKLNDSSITFEPSSSKAFGFGFKIGFLGLLHLEIVKERLEREFDLELIVTTPTVEIDQNEKGEYMEPWAKVDVMLPAKYLGGVIELMEAKRGIQKNMQHLEDNMILEYEMPLSEVIVDFYDKVKSITSGYGSINYEILDKRQANLVQLDVLIAEDKVEAFSRLVHEDFVDSVAKNLVKKLKDVVPRQNFEVKIQAAVGGRILASERIAPFRKDVTAKLYGGDVTRKRKLLEKQKKGKKKMARMGKLDIPTNVFIEILKHD